MNKSRACMYPSRHIWRDGNVILKYRWLSMYIYKALINVFQTGTDLIDLLVVFSK